MKITMQESRAARALLRWTQQELADEANVSLATIQFFESGKRYPITNNEKAIVKAFLSAGVIFETGKFIGVKIKR